MLRSGLLCTMIALGACGERAQPTPAGEPPSSTAVVDPRPRFEGLQGFWSQEQAQAIVDRTEIFDVTADTAALTSGEREALERLLAVGAILQALYEESLHPQARAVGEHLAELSVDAAERERLEALRTLYALFQGPIARVPDEPRYVAFAPVAPYAAGRNVYPSGVTAEALQTWAAAHPGSGLTDVRTVVRRRTIDVLGLDRGRLNDHPVLGVMHPQLREMLRAASDREAFYAVPYSVAYAEPLLRAYGLLREAAELVREDDADLADYLEQRARDFLSNDYEAGDAAWISGRFARLNAQIGAYETYDDHLLGRKAFFGGSLLIRVPDASDELERTVASRLAQFEAGLPGGPYERVRAEIPVGIYDVIADFGQARGGNTASILPNEAHVIRKYGRTILIRRNVLTNPALVAIARRRFEAVIAEAHAGDLDERGSFDRTVWHEVGHYLGPRRTRDGRDVAAALSNRHNHIEELKADLVSLWLVPRLVAAGVMDEARARSHYAAGVLRTLITTEPPRTNAYGTMQLMQQSWFLERGVLRFANGRLSIDYARYAPAVEAMLTEVLALQRNGDHPAAEAFIERWARWNPEVQGVLGAALDAVSPRHLLPRYAALDPAQ